MGKSIKKVLVTVLTATMIFGMTACGGSDNTGSGAGNTGKQEVKESKSEAPKIEEIDWNVDEGIVDGERTVALELTNNTKLTITGFEITFTERADLIDEEKEAFYSEIKKLFKPDDDEMETLKAEKIAMHAGTERVALPGDTISKIDVYYYGGYYYMRNLEHYSLVTPDIATISYVDGDTIYKEYYDFKSKKYTMDDEKEKAQYWTESDLGRVIPKPDVPVLKEDGRDDEECFMFDAYGMTMDDFNAYIDQCKEKGFTEDVGEHEGFYSADNAEGYNIYAYYEEDNYNLSMTVSAPEKDKKSEEKDSKESKKKVNPDEVSASVKKTLDTYEEFFDDYVAFMKKYNEGDYEDFDKALEEYSKYVDKYSDKYRELLDMAYDEELTGKDLDYYNEVVARIEKKVADY